MLNCPFSSGKMNPARECLKISLFCLIISFKLVNTYNILIALPTSFKSHYQFGSAIAKALAGEGHVVTVMSSFKQPTPLPSNYQEVHMEQTHKTIEPSNI